MPDVLARRELGDGDVGPVVDADRRWMRRILINDEQRERAVRAPDRRGAEQRRRAGDGVKFVNARLGEPDPGQERGGVVRGQFREDLVLVVAEEEEEIAVLMTG